DSPISADNGLTTASGKLCHSALCSRGRRKAPCPGYEFSTVCGTVARTGAQHRLRETPACTISWRYTPGGPDDL
ncbi:TPA: hypothetical protein ACNP4C_002367, partial [Klebsiella oxytoca]